ncbi:MAG: hypothetical protein FWB96_05220 [Defluviitaleaceae bacterium]|nr:hypothetical protein [Defluviitaleaceae bacterium]MCL2263615.1 hypothetical protein [Defluviitaleaceae bacterium]
MIKQFQKVRLKSGKEAVIIEILEQGKAFLADVEISDGEYETDEIHSRDIQSVFEEVERVLVSA